MFGAILRCDFIDNTFGSLLVIYLILSTHAAVCRTAAVCKKNNCTVTTLTNLIIMLIKLQLRYHYNNKISGILNSMPKHIEGVLMAKQRQINPTKNTYQKMK